MNHPADLETWLAINRLILDCWADVNQNAGRKVHEFYTQDGVFQVGESRHAGQKTIQDFYSWRVARGARLTRHLVSNLRVDRVSEDRATARGCVTLFGSDGVPILPAKPPTMIADFECVCVNQGNLGWKFQSHILTPLFRGEGRLGPRE